MSSPDKPPVLPPDDPPVKPPAEEGKKDKKQKRQSNDGQPEFAVAKDGVELRNLDGVASINISMKAGPVDPPPMSPPRNKSSASASAAAGFDGGIAITATAGSRRRSSSAKCVSKNDVSRAGENVVGPSYAINISRSYGTIREEGGGRQARAVKSNDSKSALQMVSTETITRRQCIYNVEQEKPKSRPTSPTAYVQGVVQSGPGYYTANAVCQSIPAHQAQQQVHPIPQMGGGYLPMRTSSGVGLVRSPSLPQQQEIAATLSRSNAGQAVSVCCRSNTQLNRSSTNLPQYGLPCQQNIQPQPVYHRHSNGYLAQAGAICQQGLTGGHQALIATGIQAPQPQAVVNQSAPMQPQCRASLTAGFQGQGVTACQAVTGYQAPPQPCGMIPMRQQVCRPSLSAGLQSQHVTNFQTVTSTGHLPPQQVCTMTTGQAPVVTSCQMTVAGCPRQSMQGYQSSAVGQPVLPVSRPSPISVQVASCQQRCGSQPIPVTHQQTMYQQHQQQYLPDTGAVYQQRTIGYRRSLEFTESQDDNRNYMPQPATTNIVLGIELKKKSSKHEKSDVDSKGKKDGSSSGRKSR